MTKRILPDTAVCHICNQTKPITDMTPAEYVRESIVDRIKLEDPDWDGRGYICYTDLNRFRAHYIQQVMVSEKGELTALDKQVMESLREHELLSANLNREFDSKLTYGERLSDKIASFGGSWTFIIWFGAIIFVWIAANSLMLLWHVFDPYPYILLNLVLSCLASLQAPIIMMSQNRQESKDRLRSEHDYRINLKAEMEIRNLHEKVDHMLTGQWQKLLEIQEIQTELMEEIAARFPKE